MSSQLLGVADASVADLAGEGGEGRNLPATQRVPWLLVTRPAAQAETWVSNLRAQGLAAWALPLMGIEPVRDAAPLRAALAQWAASPEALVMFVSPNAAQCWADAQPAGWCWPQRVWAAATGPGTAATLAELGVPTGRIVAPAADAPQFDSEALWARLSGQRWAGREVWVVRGDGGRDWFAHTLTQAGAQVRFLQAYRRVAPCWTAQQQATAAAACAHPGLARWIISSSEAVAHLERLLPGADWAKATAWASHPRIAERCRALGFGCVSLVSPTLDAVLNAVGIAANPAMMGSIES